MKLTPSTQSRVPHPLITFLNFNQVLQQERKFQDLIFLLAFADLKKHFEVPPYSQQVSRGDQVQIRCHPPKGRPAPRISWMQNDRLIDAKNDQNFIVTGEGHLIVVAARLTDNANYTCVAENVASKRFSDPATITVYGKNFFVLEATTLLKLGRP